MEALIDHAAKDARGRYWTETRAGEAELTYSLRGGVMVVDHTYVPPDARGGGVALSLVERIVEDAKGRGLKIDPVCPYVARVFDRRRDWSGLRA